jgi:hypothetical protein
MNLTVIKGGFGTRNVEFADDLNNAKRNAAGLLLAIGRFTELYPCVMADGLCQLASDHLARIEALAEDYARIAQVGRAVDGPELA